MPKNKKKKTYNISLPLLFFLSFLLLFFSFKGFFLGQLVLTNDAVPYFEHFKFYLDSISRGVYPLWDPTMNSGTPSEFFLRRIGSFNPLYIIIILLNSLGMTYKLSYLFFLGLYYFLGMIGFYLVAKCLFKDVKTAFFAYLLLMFSSLSTTLFNSFLILVFVPGVWFFYFFMRFSNKPNKLFFLGMIFTLMIIVTTYLPFYFLTLWITFIIFYLLFYFKTLNEIFVRYYKFIKNNKIFVTFCIVVLIISLIPGILLLNDAGKGELSLPARHKHSLSNNVLEVAKQTYVDGGIVTTTIFDDLFSNFDNFQLGKFYIPIFAHIVFLLALIVPINKRIMMLVFWSFLLFIVGVYEAAPAYQFLYKHVFFIKYMRNFQYFLWLNILPVYILICSDHFSTFINDDLTKTYNRKFLLIFYPFIHILFGVLLFIYKGLNFSSFLVIFLSLLFFLLYFIKKIKKKDILILISILLIALIHPLTIYGYLEKNAIKAPKYYRYELPYLNLGLPYSGKIKLDKCLRLNENILNNNFVSSEGHDLWIGTKWTSLLTSKINSDIFKNYFSNKLLIYDNAEYINEEKIDFKKITDTFAKFPNRALLINNDTSLKENTSSNYTNNDQHVEIVDMYSTKVKVIDFDVNHIKLETNFNKRKLLVYNDSYHSGWHAYINGKKADLLRANIAFKGIWVPEGENIVYMKYGDVWDYVFNYLLIFIFWFILLYLMILWVMGRCKKLTSS